MIRIGESRLARARERRWSRPYNALDPAVLRLQEEEAPDRRRAIRLGIAAAIAFHVLLFFIVFPAYYEERILKVGRVIRHFASTKDAVAFLKKYIAPAGD